ncbi:parallel beta-helix repeat protein [Paraburkholderia sp. WC7.3g]|uniref:NosD domain-containing protein n=1 Tax=Paraburkholderia sp. WC7.3g TaxID=2991070 RepID=UPI003D1DEF56
MRLTGNGELRFVSGITGSAAITVSADYCEFDGVFVTNPNLLQEQTGNRMSAITFLANYGKVVNSTVQYFQHGVIVESTGEYHDFIISNNKILDCIGAGDGPSNTTSGNGEDRGDGITVWGCCATITGNLVTAKAGQDCRIGIHMEGMPTYHADSYPLEENLGTISGNVVRGSFRRSIVLEQVNNVTVSANTCQGATWWGIAVIKAIACTINGNTILYTRASTDQTGGSWSPIHAGVNLYGGCINCVVNANTIDTSRGFADTGIYLQGLNSDSQVQGTQAATSTGTATLTLSAVNPVIDVGQLVTGTGVPAGTYVLSVIGTTLYLSNAVTAGTPTLTFTTHDRGVGNVVTNNTVLCNGGQTQSGIWAQYQDYPVINNNGVRNPTTYGVTGYDIAYPVINGNNLAGFKGVNYGIQLVSNTTAVVINGNLISGFTVAGAVGIGVQNRVGGVISGNFVTGSPTDIDLWACTQMVVTSNNSVGATTHYSNGTGTGMTLANNTYS